MFKILTLNNISKKGLELFPDTYQISDNEKEPDGIILRSYKMHDMEIPASVKAIARAGAGTNNIPIDRCTERGIVVFNTPGANANSVKELVLTGLLISSRRIIRGIDWVHSLDDDADAAKLIEKEKSKFAGPEISGKKLGVVGLGAIGVMVANAAVSLGMEVTGFDPFITVGSAWELNQQVRRSDDLKKMLADSDYISLHAPLNDKTAGMIGKEEFAQMKPGARLLNFARGGLVDTDALKQSLDQGKIDRYVTDFPDNEIFKHDRVIPFPHLGASTPEAEENCAKMAVRQLMDYLERGVIKNSVNFPEKK
ncbi:MAG: 3-phosphoglycerate dehydrogenase [Spirochaetia bacterium]